MSTTDDSIAALENMSVISTPSYGRSKGPEDHLSIASSFSQPPGSSLKEQSRIIDRLSKENWDLKLKIHFLNKRLNERSDENVERMIRQDAEYKAAFIKMRQEMTRLKDTVRDQERELKQKSAGMKAAEESEDQKDRELQEIDERLRAAEESEDQKDRELRVKEERLKAAEEALDQKNRELQEKDERLQAAEDALDQKNRELQEKDEQLQATEEALHQRNRRSVSTTSINAGRDEHENRNIALRDMINHLKLKNQDLTRKLERTHRLEGELERCIDEIERRDSIKRELDLRTRRYQHELHIAERDLQTMQAERDELLELREASEAQFADLRQAAQREIDLADDRVEERETELRGRETELREKETELRRLEVEIKDGKEKFDSLQDEMHSLSQVVQRLEVDLQSSEKCLEDTKAENARLEAILQAQRTGSQNSAPEIARLRGENRLLKGELEKLKSAGTLTIPSAPIEPTQQRWVHRLKELETRLKAEREARLVDRSGAKKRLEQGRVENQELRMELERERVRRAEL